MLWQPGVGEAGHWPGNIEVIVVPSEAPPIDILIACPDRIWPVAGGGAARIFALLAHLRAEGFRVGLALPSHGGIHNAEIAALTDVAYFKRDGGSTARNVARRMPGRVQRALIGLRHGAVSLRHRARHVLPESVRAGVIRPLRAALTGHAQGAPAPEETNSFLAAKIRPAFNDFARSAVLRSGARVAIVVYPWSARALDGLPPGILKVIDTIDVQHLRRQKAREAGHDLPDRECTREEERAELAHADVLIAIQAGEAEIFREMLPGHHVVTAEHAVGPLQWHRAPESARELLYVGNLYPPNVAGAIAFLDHVWPKIHAQVPGARFTICGKVCEALLGRSDPGLHLAGRVPSLDEHYARAAIVLNLVPYGTGLKIKTVEALAHGKCAVVTPAGAEGLRVPPGDALHIADLDAMADTLVQLLRDPAARAHTETAARAYAQQHLSPAATYAELTTLLHQHLRQGQ